MELHFLSSIRDSQHTLGQMNILFRLHFRSAIFWDITQRVVSILYRHFGTTYRSHLQGSRILLLRFLYLKDETDMLSRNVGKELPQYAEQYSRRAQISSTWWRQSEIRNRLDLFLFLIFFTPATFSSFNNKNYIRVALVNFTLYKILIGRKIKWKRGK